MLVGKVFYFEPLSNFHSHQYLTLFNKTSQTGSLKLFQISSAFYQKQLMTQTMFPSQASKSVNSFLFSGYNMSVYLFIF